MKKFYIFAAVFFLSGIFSVSAQDIIVLKDGNTIEAKVLEISPTEIRYLRFDNLDGPVIVIARYSVLSIRYENGVTEIIDDAQEAKPKTPAMNPEKLTFSLSIEPAGFLAGGPSVSGEFTKHKLNTQFHVSFPTLVLNSTASGFGLGFGFGLNYFYHTRIGGFYAGGMFEYNLFHAGTESGNRWQYTQKNGAYIEQYVQYTEDIYAHNFILALNLGYKFVTNSGIYFRTGVCAGVKLSAFNDPAFYYKPDLATGYSF